MLLGLLLRMFLVSAIVWESFVLSGQVAVTAASQGSLSFWLAKRVSSLVREALNEPSGFDTVLPSRDICDRPDAFDAGSTNP